MANPTHTWWPYITPIRAVTDTYLEETLALLLLLSTGLTWPCCLFTKQQRGGCVKLALRENIKHNAFPNETLRLPLGERLGG